MKIEGTVLVSDKNKGMLTALLHLLQKEFSRVIAETDEDKIIQLVKENCIEIFVLDAGQNSLNEESKLIDFIKKIKETDPFIQIILLTNFSQNKFGLEAVESGAFDYLSKPWNNEKLVVTLRNGYKMREQMTALRQLNALKETTKSKEHFFWGISDTSKGIFEAAKQQSQSNSPLLIYGEKGTGKELLAQQIHSIGPRGNFAFIKIDSNEISDAEFERKLAIADGGTVYIDRIELLDIHKQKILVDIINNKISKGLDNITSIKSNVRIIAGSSSNWTDGDKSEHIDKDLNALLGKNRLRMPSLNERKEDILPIAKLLLEKYCKKHRKHITGFTELSKEILMENRWAGNTSELSLAIERAVITAPDGGAVLPGYLLLAGESGEVAKNSINTLTIEQMEAKMMRAALKKNNGNITLAAEQLGITRQTLYNKGKKHNLFK